MPTDLAPAALASPSVAVPWALSFTSSYLLGTLSSLTGLTRSKLAAEFLSSSLRHDGEFSDEPCGLALRESGRARAGLRVPRDLVERLTQAAARRACEPEVLVEFLFSAYLPGALAEAAARQTARSLIGLATDSATPLPLSA